MSPFALFQLRAFHLNPHVARRRASAFQKPNLDFAIDFEWLEESEIEVGR